MFGLIALELRLLLRDRAVIAMIAVLIGALVLASVNGAALMGDQQGARASALASKAEAEQTFATRLADATLPPEDAILSPYRMRSVVVAPLPVLADFSAGRTAFEPVSATITMRSRADSLFQRGGLDNPELLMRGSIDLGFVVVVLAPLILTGLLYGLFAADRDSGTARLIMAQAGNPVQLVAARIIPRLALVFVPIALAACVLLAIGPDVPGRWAAAGAWLLVAAIFLIAWAALAAWINSLDVSAESAAFSLVAVWALFTLVLPAAFAAIVQATYPPPSRFEQIATARAAEVSSTEAYENDHPDLASNEFEGRLASIRKTWEVAQQIDAATAPLSAQFSRQLGAQQRFAEALAWLSPSLIARTALEQIAGTDARASEGFRAASTAHLVEVRQFGGGVVERGDIMGPADLERMPRFAWSPAAQTPWGALALLAALAAGLIALALRRFAKLRLA